MASSDIAVELRAVQAVHEALRPLKEGQREFVLRTACDKLKVKISFGDVVVAGDNRSASSGTPHMMQAQTPAPATTLTSANPKRFLATKNPSQDIERVTCLAYMLTHLRNTPEFKTNELTKMNMESAGRRLSNPSIAARNAANAGYLAPAGKGRKQITALGEQIVDALPDREKVSAVLANAGSRGRRRPGRKRGQAARR